MFVSWLFIMSFSCSLLNLSLQYLLCKLSYLLLGYKIVHRAISCRIRKVKVFSCDEAKNRHISKIFVSKIVSHSFLPIPPVQMHICLDFTKNLTDKGFEGNTPTPEKKSHAGYCKAKERDLLTPAPLVCHPLISLSTPSSGSFHCPLQLKTPCQRRAELHFCKTLRFWQTGIFWQQWAPTQLFVQHSVRGWEDARGGRVHVA